MSQRKIRLLLLLCVSFVTALLMLFLWAINLNQPDELRAVLNKYLIIVGSFALVALGLFFLKGSIFNEEGKLESGRILIMTTVVLLVAQIVFTFANYAYQKVENTFTTLDRARTFYESIRSDYYDSSSNTLLSRTDKTINMVLSDGISEHEEISAAVLTDNDGRVLYTTDAALEGTVLEADPLRWYSFPLPEDDAVLRLEASVSYRDRITDSILSELLTIMAASVFLTIELMLFALKVIVSKSSKPGLINGKPPQMALRYVRQVAFLFYFGSQLASSFLSVYARELGGSVLGMSGNVLAAVPQSAETLLTCAAILFTSALIERRGWRLPFMGGLLLVAAGTLGSSFAPNIALYIAARAVVGLGYGFCWMTLRNFALFGRDETEKSKGFSLLNAGLYAGINCGSVLGSILAEKLGYSMVFTISAVFTLLCALFIMRMENAVYVRPAAEKAQNREKGAGQLKLWLPTLIFLVLMITPACVSGSFLSYYLPLYFTDIGRSVADVGRAKLLYGILIIYAGPVLAQKFAASRYPGLWNVAYILLIGAAFVLFGLVGGLYAAFAAVLILGFSDSFGFVAQNNYFLDMPLVRRLGESRSLSALSLIKKLLEMTGPIVFGLAISGDGTGGVFAVGAFTVCAAVLFALLLRMWKKKDMAETSAS